MNQNYYTPTTLGAMRARRSAVTDKIKVASDALQYAVGSTVGDTLPVPSNWSAGHFSPSKKGFGHGCSVQYGSWIGDLTEWPPEIVVSILAAADAHASECERQSAEYADECRRVSGERIAAQSHALAHLCGPSATISQLESAITALRGGAR